MPRLKKIKVSLQSAGSGTNILDLNDDCLREVFEFLNIWELVTVADVCTRFKQIAAQCTLLKQVILGFDWHSSCVFQYSLLRKFGATTNKIEVNGDTGRNLQRKFKKKLIDHLNQYWVAEPKQLKISSFKITDEMANSMQPVLGQVRKLEIIGCEREEALLQNLPIWAPQLRELRYACTEKLNVGENKFHCLRQTFPTLVSISFERKPNIKNLDIGEFLKWNPQLKHISVSECDMVDDNIVQSIATHVPGIEGISFITLSPVNGNNSKYFRNLSHLKSLTWRVQFYEPSLLHEISSTKNALEYLKLDDFNFSGYGLKMTTSDLLKLIQNSKRLQRFQYKTNNGNQISSIIIDTNTFKRLVEIVQQRREKMKLRLIIHCSGAIANVPAELVEENRDWLQIEINGMPV